MVAKKEFAFVGIVTLQIYRSILYVPHFKF